MIPDRERCRSLLDEAGCSRAVVDHVETVEALARRLAEHASPADVDIVTAGALLHDIGRGFDHGPGHVPAAIAFLTEHDVDERVVACVARHMGAGVDTDQAVAWGWPTQRSYVPETLEERIVAHADNLTSGTTYRTLAETVAKLRDEGLGDVADRVRELHAGLGEELGVDPDQIAGEIRREARDR